MKVKLMLCALMIIQDAETNNASAIQILEEFTPLGGFPAVLPVFATLIALVREEHEPTNIACSIHAIMGEEELLSQNIPMDFQDKLRVQMKFRFSGLPVQRPGPLTVKFACKEFDLEEIYEFVIKPPPSKVEPNSLLEGE